MSPQRTPQFQPRTQPRVWAHKCTVNRCTQTYRAHAQSTASHFRSRGTWGTGATWAWPGGRCDGVWTQTGRAPTGHENTAEIYYLVVIQHNNVMVYCNSFMMIYIRFRLHTIFFWWSFILWVVTFSYSFSWLVIIFVSVTISHGLLGSILFVSCNFYFAVITSTFTRLPQIKANNWDLTTLRSIFIIHTTVIMFVVMFVDNFKLIRGRTFYNAMILG